MADCSCNRQVVYIAKLQQYINISMHRLTSFKFPAKPSKLFSFFLVTTTATATGVAALTFSDDVNSFSSEICSPFSSLRRSSHTIFTVPSSLSFVLFSAVFYLKFGRIGLIFSLCFSLFLQIALTVFDYKYTLHGLVKGSDVYRNRISEVYH